jgi:hypothetical protein
LDSDVGREGEEGYYMMGKEVGKRVVWTDWLWGCICHSRSDGTVDQSIDRLN